MIHRTPISVSQLSDLLGVEPGRFVAVERRCGRGENGWYVVTEGEEMVQTTGTCPQIHDNTRRKPTKKGGRKK